MQNTMGEKKNNYAAGPLSRRIGLMHRKNNAQKSEFIYRIDLNGYIRSYLSQTQH